jgi:YHS domain-containing protein
MYTGVVRTKTDHTLLKDHTIRRVKTMVKDPVCGMDVDPKKASDKSEYQGQTYYFCSSGCKKAFDKEPQKYIKKTGDSHSSHH